MLDLLQIKIENLRRFNPTDIRIGKPQYDVYIIAFELKEEPERRDDKETRL